MTTIRITSTDQALVTARELLEDFADSSPGWQYLDSVSSHYANARGANSCVLRSWNTDVPGSADIAFGASSPASMELRIVAKDHVLPPAERSEVIDALVADLRSYLEARSTGIRVEEAATA